MCGTDEVADGVWAVALSHVEGKAAVVSGRRQTLVVDTGKDPAEGAAIASVVSDLGRTADVVVYSHGHWDHVRGGPVFAQTTLVCHADAASDVRTQLAEVAPPGAVPAVALPGEPTWEIHDRVRIDLGGRHVMVLPTPGHAPGSVSVLVPDAGVLIGGDTVVTAIPPAFKHGDSGTLEATVRELVSFDARVLIPGHGPVLSGATPVREWLIFLADYLRGTADIVDRELARGAPVDTIVRQASWDALIGRRLRADEHRNTWRHEQTARQMLFERGVRA